MDKRTLIQLITTLVYNADIRVLHSGGISRTPLKNTCVPGLNCYSCPTAVAACPLGSLQNALGGGRIPFFMAGFFLLTGSLLGRTVCGFLCPFGWIQELLNKAAGALRKLLPFLARKAPAPGWKHTHMGALSRRASLIKYGLLALFVLALPLLMYFKDGIGSPYFCSLICPAGSLEAGLPLIIADENLRAAIGFLFGWKTLLLAGFLIWSWLVYRPFCRYICPLGAIYSFFNRFAVFGVRVDTSSCTGCGRCIAECRMDTRFINDRECIRCGDCMQSCAVGAISIGVGPITVPGGLYDVKKSR